MFTYFPLKMDHYDGMHQLMDICVQVIAASSKKWRIDKAAMYSNQLIADQLFAIAGTFPLLAQVVWTIHTMLMTGPDAKGEGGPLKPDNANGEVGPLKPDNAGKLSNKHKTVRFE